jgi:FAD-dependent urate hydroxylase
VQDLAERARREIDLLSYPAKEWVLPREHDGEPMLDALIVGGGQGGISIAFRLLRESVTNVRIVDRRPKDREGPWVTFARMHTLRTPKHVTGPELGIPSLAVRAWWEARYGAESWDALGRIPRETWHEYLTWLRRTLDIPIDNNTEVTALEPLDEGGFAVRLAGPNGAETVFVRNVIMATGMEGCGRWAVPAMVTEALPKSLYAHTVEDIDFAALKGKRIAAIGAGAGAFDNAAVALETGAASVDLYVRRRVIPPINPNRWMESAGFMRCFGDLDDSHKWSFMKTIFDMNQPPPKDTFERCTRHANFDFHLGSPILSVATAGDGLTLTTPHGSAHFDFLIVGTGLEIDLSQRPEMAGFWDRIALWSDRYTPPPAEQSPTMANYPYMSDSYQFTEKKAGSAPWLKNLFSFTFAAMPSLAGSSGISSLKFGVERLALGVCRELYREDADRHLASLKAFDEPELELAAVSAALAERAARQS